MRIRQLSWVVIFAGLGCGGGGAVRSGGPPTGGTGGQEEEDAGYDTGLIPSPGGIGGSTPDAAIIKVVDAAPPDLRPADGPVAPEDGGGPDAGPADAGAPDTTPDMGDGNVKLCTEYWTVNCAKYDTCSKLVLKRDYGGDVASCIAYGTKLCMGADNPAAGLMPAMLRACTAEIDKGSCSDFLSGALQSCRLTGSRQNGAKCSYSRDCQSGRCAGGDLGQCGTCGGLASEGGPCERRRDCAPGMLCNSAHACAKPRTADQPCTGAADCGKGFFCNGTACAALITTAGAKCESNGCDLDQELFCHETKKICVAVELAKGGQECGLFDNKAVLCAAGSCSPPSGAAAHGTCPMATAEGQPCKADSVCADGTICSEGTCRKPPQSCQ
jgi:hypothetical protein